MVEDYVGIIGSFTNGQVLQVRDDKIKTLMKCLQVTVSDKKLPTADYEDSREQKINEK